MRAHGSTDACLSLLLRVCAQTLDRKLRNERDTHMVLEREAARLRIEVEAHSKRVARAQEVRPVRNCLHSDNTASILADAPAVRRSSTLCPRR